MDDSDLQKYVIEQARIEVDHARSWPTKIFAFYVAINFGVVGALFTLANRKPPIILSYCPRILITLAVLGLATWAIALLWRNHTNYLRHRNVQVAFQKETLQAMKDKYQIPADWFKENDLSHSVRFVGWGFYLYLMIVVTFFSIAGIWVGWKT